MQEGTKKHTSFFFSSTGLLSDTDDFDEGNVAGCFFTCIVCCDDDFCNGDSFLSSSGALFSICKEIDVKTNKRKL